MQKKNEQTNDELVEEPIVTEEETDTDDDFDGPLNPVELENDEFDDWNPELDELQSISKTNSVSKNTTPVYALDKKRIEDASIPTKFICALSKQIMLDPVRIAGSKVPVAYDKTAIEAHYEEFGTDPMTHEYLDDEVEFIPDLALKREISDFCIQKKLMTEITPPVETKKPSKKPHQHVERQTREEDLS